MGLVAVLSNTQTEVLYQRLTKRNWRQVPREQAKRRDRTIDGKLRPGTVSNAVLAVMAKAASPLRFIEIHARVEQLLAMPVHGGTVKQFLSAEAAHPRARVVRLERGLYRMDSH